jgi:hypothetical protein
VQLVSASTKLRQMFYTQIERRSFHTAWVKLGRAGICATCLLLPNERTFTRTTGTSVGAKGGSAGCFEPNRSRAPTAIASLHQSSKNALGTEKGRKLQDNQELVHAVAVRANMRSILVAMMKSFSCSPLIFSVCRETVALPQPKLIFG